MLKMNSFVLMAASGVIMSAIISGGNCLAQCGSSCAGACSSCGLDGQFGYPGGAAGYGGRGHHGERMDQIRAENAKITARNDAWPKPFACADRQLYHDIWAPMLAQGVEEQCLLSAEHFDNETNELNKFGVSAVAGIMQNMPSVSKNVYIHRDSNEAISQARLDNVNSVIQTMYGQIAPNAQVAFSDKMPSSISGIRAETISQKFIKAAPKPVIPIASGSGSVTSSVN